LELDEYKREVDVIETKYKTKQQVAVKSSQNKQISIIIIIIALNHYSFLLFFFQNTKLKQKTNSKTFKVKFKNIINASVTEDRTKKIANFLHDNISALLSSAGLHLSVFSQIESEEIKQKPS
jgi:signal transduction histidine kinase